MTSPDRPTEACVTVVTHGPPRASVGASRRWRPVAALVTVVCLSACSPQQFVAWAFAREGASSGEQQRAVDIAECESRFVETARNGRHVGWFQINVDLHQHRAPWADLTNGPSNAVVAAGLWAAHGWSPWEACL